MTAAISLIVNGRERRIKADPDKPLLWVLRDELALTSAKYSCGIGICGACLVKIDADVVPSCVTAVSKAVGKDITTLEGLDGTIADTVRAAWIAEDVPQCGYCQSGQIVAATELLSINPAPSDDEIGDAMSRVLCRCGTYGAIRRAIRRAVGEI